MSLNEALIYDVYNMHYQTAKKEHQQGNMAKAKQAYLNAAETMLKLAKISEGSLKLARLEKAKKLSQIALDLEKTSLDIQSNKEVPPTIWKPVDVPNTSFDDIAGLDEVKNNIKVRMIYPMIHKDKYEIYNKKQGGGVLLYGPPGTGKTMIARAIAHEVKAVFFVVKPSDILSKYVGKSENHIKSLFDSVRKHQRVVLFFDELDGLFKVRGNDEHNDRRISEFLQQMDGFEKIDTQFLMLGATNRPWDVDQAARRPGRFAQSIYIPLPDYEARKYIIKKSLKNIPGFVDLDIHKFTELTDGYSGADIDELCDQAKEFPLMKSIQSNQIENITNEDLMNALKVLKPSVTKKDLLAFEKFKDNR